jgi:RNA polymerase sigma-70 factor (ECF subfamily)
MRSAVRAYLPHVLRAARGAGLDPAEAEEVTQRTFTTFFEKAQRFEGRSSVRTWLFGILYRKIFERRRELARDEQRQEAIDEAFESRFDEAGRWIRPPHPAPDAALAAKETRRHISECLDQAPARQKASFLLREVEGFSTAEIGEILGMTQTNVGVTLHRVRHRLRECLETRGLRGTEP